MKHLLKSFWNSLFFDKSLLKEDEIVIHNPQNIQIFNSKNNDDKSLPDNNLENIPENPNADFSNIPKNVKDELNGLNPSEILNIDNGYYEDEPEENQNIENVISQLDNQKQKEQQDNQLDSQNDQNLNIDPNTGSPIDTSFIPQFLTYEQLNKLYQNQDQNINQNEIPLAQPPQIDQTNSPQLVEPLNQELQNPQINQNEIPLAQPPQIDPNTGQPLNIQNTDENIIPQNQNLPNPQDQFLVQPQIDPTTGQPLPQQNEIPGQTPTDQQSLTIGNITDSLKGPAIPLDDLSRINELKKINTRLNTMEDLIFERSGLEYKKIGDNIKESLEYFKHIITNLDSFIQYNTDPENKYSLIDELILKFKRFIYITLLELKNIDNLILNNQDFVNINSIKTEEQLYGNKTQ